MVSAITMTQPATFLSSGTSRKALARSSALPGRRSPVVAVPRRTRTTIVRAEKQDGAEKNKKTLSNIDSLLGLEPEPEPEPEPTPVPVKIETQSVQPPQPQPRKKVESDDWILEDFEADGKVDIPSRALASASYMLPLLDGLRYGRYLFMQVPQFALVLLPLAPAIELFQNYRWLQIVFFFGLALGVANNRSLPKFTRFNAQQAILLDILQIVPELLLGRNGPPPGDDFLLQATIIFSNTVFLYVYLCCVTGSVAALSGKAIRLPLLGEAAESQANR